MIWDIVVVGFPVMWPLFACAFTWAAGLLTGAGFQRRVFYIAWAGSSLLDVALFLALRQWLEAAWAALSLLAALYLWWRGRKDLRRITRLAGAKSRALLAALARKAREAARPRPVLRPAPGGAG